MFYLLNYVPVSHFDVMAMQYEMLQEHSETKVTDNRRRAYGHLIPFMLELSFPPYMYVDKE